MEDNYQDVELSDEQQRVYNIMESTYDNMFITGKAGTGKSVLLQYFVHHTAKEVAVVAPTGVAALNVGGQTINSFFKIDLGVQNPKDEKKVTDFGGNQRKKLMKELDTLVIDEVSMVRADLMDMIDAKLKIARNNKEPFGGCQLIVFGDLYQLPPVVSDNQVLRYLKDKYGTIYFFGAPVIQSHPFRIIELQHVFRQKDAEFIEILNSIRLGKVSSELLADINNRCVRPPENKQYITLTGRNMIADRINQRNLNLLNSQLYSYDGTLQGDIKQSGLPTDMNLGLKVGAQVMMIKNDRTHDPETGDSHPMRWVNGSLGTVSSLTSSEVEVKIGERRYKVNQEIWEKAKYDYDNQTKQLEKTVVARFMQYPIKLAYAVTIHKSQGQTYDAVKIDLSSGAFATGQTYVALSRCRSMSMLYLTTPLRPRDIMVSPEVVKYMAGAEIE